MYTLCIYVILNFVNLQLIFTADSMFVYHQVCSAMDQLVNKIIFFRIAYKVSACLWINDITYVLGSYAIY
jgi:hypothetical protein